MIPDIYILFGTEVFKFFNLLLEGTPIEQRKANSIIWFNTTWPIFKGLLPKVVQDQVEQTMATVK